MDKFICWTDTNNRKHMASADNVVILVPGLNGDTASIFINSYDATTFNNKSSTSPGAIFMMPTIYEALRFIKTGNKDRAIYGNET